MGKSTSVEKLVQMVLYLLFNLYSSHEGQLFMNAFNR